MKKGEIFLPRTPEEFETLVDRVVQKFDLPDRRHAASVISVAIRHINNNTATTTLEYLGHTVLKNLANHICNVKNQIMQHESEVTSLLSMLEQDPANQQARDELQKAADDGSKFAKEALKKLETKGAEAAAIAVASGVTQH